MRPESRGNPSKNASGCISTKTGDSARPLRVVLFTDTLGDVNGVSRFISTMAEHALACTVPLNLDLHVITSTRFACPPLPNIHNLPPRFARPMPGYPALDLVIPHRALLESCANACAPDVVHVSTPGPVGALGRRWALRRHLPLVGTYHTDFPAYIEHLFDDVALTLTCRRLTRWFYKPFAAVLTRSAEYAGALHQLGVQPARVVRLVPGIDTDAFHVRHADATVWASAPGVRPGSVKALYVGRVSVEKNLPQLAKLWPRIHSRCQSHGVDTQFLVIGDGPYRHRMQAELAPHEQSVCFLGFRFGSELSRIYASSHLFLFPSTTDTLGQVVMEAQCSGLPVIVTDQGGPKGVVDDGVTGLVLPPIEGAAGQDAWINAAVRLLCDRDLRTRMGAAAHAKIAPMSIGHSVQQFRDVHAAVRSSWS